MGGFARGGIAPAVTWLLMGISIEAIALIVDDLDGLAHVFGMLCFMLTAIIANFYRDPDRPIPKEDGIVVSPADGHIMFVVRERATGRRPAKSESSIHDELTGDWHETPCDQPLNFSNEQRWEAVPEGEESASDALRSGLLTSLALDVFDTEPLDDSPLLSHDGFHGSPHIAASTVEAQSRIGSEMASLLLEFFESGQPSTSLNHSSLP